MEELPKQYNPKETEDKWYSYWEQSGFFSAKVDPAKTPFTIVIPPPNITGILHMGHALNNTIQDILTRYHRMKGEGSLWMPGTDHAGIATQNVVEKSIAKQGLTRQDLGREKFIEKVWQWRDIYGSTIIRQLKKLGSSCDWTRLRFTMDEDYSSTVKEVFVRLYEKGLIYRGDYIINWCPRCSTALSDEEAPHRSIQGNLYYLKYPMVDSPEEFVVVATTRPETMLGDTAVAVNPKDKRYKKLVGKDLLLPLVNRKIKIIADNCVDMEFGTGAVKVTPAHDPNDYALGKRHGLKFINIMHPNAVLNGNAGDYANMDRFEARQALVEDLKQRNLLAKVEPHTISAGHCYRCSTIIEPYLSAQWFVKMKPLSLPAIKAVRDKKINFYPKRWTKVYLNWMTNIQDWCISRQIWWGHRLPVYYCPECSKKDPAYGIIVSRTPVHKCPNCASSGVEQDPDVLDTWFSSWLWPFATFGWPNINDDLKYFYPTSVLVTAPEIIFFWVARMIMAGEEFMRDIPFRDVYIHGTVRDIEGKKMSKSLGNIIDPLEIIEQFGTDALRFSLISITAQGQDVFLSRERFEQGRNFANKIWNASRLILMNLESDILKNGIAELKDKNIKLGLVNRWILSRFNSVLKDLDKFLLNYKFNEAANLLYSFFWHEFCDWYLEIIKPEIKNAQNQAVVAQILEKFLKASHPFMPFVTEEIWQKVKALINMEGKSIMISSWPISDKKAVDKELEDSMQSLFTTITVIRNLRSSICVKPEQKVKVSVYPQSPARKKLVLDNQAFIANLANLEAITLIEKNIRPKAVISAVAGELDIYLHVEGLLDIEAEKVKINRKIDEIKKAIIGKEAMLKNRDFVKKAPEAIVEKEKNSLQELNNSLDRLIKMSEEL
jgi:valyl-tRNA synthetase